MATRDQLALFGLIAVLAASSPARAQLAPELEGRFALGLGVGQPLFQGRLLLESEWWANRDLAGGLHVGLGRGRTPGGPWYDTVTVLPQLVHAREISRKRALFSIGAGWSYTSSSAIECFTPLCGWIPPDISRHAFIVAAQAALLVHSDDTREGVLLLRAEYMSTGFWTVIVGAGLDFGGR